MQGRMATAEPTATVAQPEKALRSRVKATREEKTIGVTPSSFTSLSSFKGWRMFDQKSDTFQRMSRRCSRKVSLFDISVA